MLSSLNMFLFDDPATTQIYTLSLHDALPICGIERSAPGDQPGELRLDVGEEMMTDAGPDAVGADQRHRQLLPPRRADRKSTRLNSSHTVISYAVFCLKKKNREGFRVRCNTPK